MKHPLFCLAIALTLAAVSSPALLGQSPRADREYVPGEVLIQFEDGTTATHRAEARSWVAGSRRELLRRGGAGGDLELAQIRGRSVEQALAALRSHPAVRHAEPNWILRSLETSDDPRYTNGSMWGMYGDTTSPHTNQFGSQAGEAWEAGNVGSASVAIGVIDEGIQIDHPDLAANIWTNPAEAAGQAGVDDDGNGYIDDLHGWDFYNNDNTVFDGPGDDHGTHVAGTIGAIGGNATGVAGVNWHVTMVSAKFLGSGGGTTAAAIKAIDYVTDVKKRHGLNIVATSNSWGGGGASNALLNAIVRGANENILFIAAAGNASSNNDTAANYPSNYDTTAGAGYDAVIAVASITSAGAMSGFSNYGATSVDLGAPGSGIVSTVPGGSYASYDGTSMATPHVSGAAALYASVNPHASARKIREVILAAATATPTPSMNGKTTTGGRLNIGEFAGPAPAAPSAPANLTATAASAHQIDLDWDDTATNEDAFRIERCQGDGCSNFAELAIVDYPGYSDTGLPSNTPFRYRVQAFNRGGASDHSNVADAATPPPPPPSPAAGDDQSVNEGDTVTLDGSQSSHPENAPLTFEWEQVDGPAVALAGANTSQPTFTAPAVAPAGATLTFTLWVTADGVSAADSVTVTVLNVNTAPEVTSAAPLTATEDVQYVYAATAVDDDGPLTWSLLGDHTCGGSIDSGSGLFTFTPAGPVPAASCVVSVQVCDGADPSLCDAETTAVSISAVNDPPAFAPPADITAEATSAAGAAVTYAVTDGSDPEDGPLAPACAPASGSIFPIGVTTVSCTVTDGDGGSTTGSFTVTVTNPAAPGEMRGGGFIRGEDARLHFTFEARERSATGERGRLDVRIDEHGKKRGKTRDDRFQSRSADYVRFQADTVLFSGAGEWNGQGGYRYEVWAQDAGEPGRHGDAIRVTIWNAAGAVVASFEGAPDGGNIQSSRRTH